MTSNWFTVLQDARKRRGEWEEFVRAIDGLRDRMRAVDWEVRELEEGGEAQEMALYRAVDALEALPLKAISPLISDIRASLGEYLEGIA